MPELSGLHFQRVASNMFKSFCYRQSVAPFNHPFRSTEDMRDWSHRGGLGEWMVQNLAITSWSGCILSVFSMEVTERHFCYSRPCCSPSLSSDIITSIFSRKRLAAIFLNIKSLSASMFFVDKQLYRILSAAFRFVYARHSAARYPHRHDRQRLAERLQVGETDQTEGSSLAIQIHDCRRKCLKRHWFFTSNLRQTLDVGG